MPIVSTKGASPAGAYGFMASARDPRIPPVTSGLVSVYDGDSWTGSQWSDIYGTNHVTSVSGTITKSTTTTGNGASKTFTSISGNTGSALLFPTAILPSTYTLFHVTRLTGGTRRRIWTGYSNNWLSGFWNGCTAVAYHEGWVTASSGDPHGNNWAYHTDQIGLFRSNGTTRGTGGGTQSTRLGLNWSNVAPTETSDWQTALVVVYNTALSSTDYTAVESWIADRYGI